VSGILILAHQDDEVFFLNLVLRSEITHVFYLTDGVRTGANYSSDIRSNEASNSWNLIGQDVEILQIGQKFQINDGILHEKITPSLIAEIQTSISAINPSFILTTLNDGSHQDHDSVFLLAKSVKPKDCTLYAFPSYRANYFYPKFFRVLKIPPRMSSVEVNIRGSLSSTFTALRIMKLYSTQKKTWLGLGPAVLLRLLLGFKVAKYETCELVHVPKYYFYDIRNRATVNDVTTSLLRSFER
jgi:LmbE family N-acetylglucosaminyl deacetylase